jgi:cell pole-organizing protein PopZ
MNQPAKAQEPSMEEILASIRRIIADEDTSKTAPKAAAAMPPAPTPVTPPPAAPPRAAAPAPRPAAPPPAQEPALKQAEIDAMLSDLTAPQAPPAPAAPDVLELTESMAASPAPPAAGGFRTIDGQSDIVFEESDTESPDDLDDGRDRRFEAIKPDLISSSTSDAVNSAFNTLAQTVLVQNARTLEDLVREMLRPMLKTWLDDNLPGLVERLVRQEIDRVSRGRS